MPDYPSLLSVPYQSAHSEYDVLVLPGGGPGAKTFCETDAVLELIASFRKAGKLVAAICAGTTALVAAEKKHDGGKGKVKVTSHPSVKEEVVAAGWEYSEERVAVSAEWEWSEGEVGVVGGVVTSRGYVIFLGEEGREVVVFEDDLFACVENEG